jgi:Family of unknown function (DUF6328)
MSLIHGTRSVSTRARRCPSCDRPDVGHDDWNEASRGESPLQRIDRAYGELLQEVRVAQTGVQVLMAFLLVAAFTPGFALISTYLRSLYVAALVLAALATALLIAPATCHRFTYGRRMKGVTLKIACVCAHGGYALLFCALSCAMLLILNVVLEATIAIAVVIATALWFVGWWYVLPLAMRRRHRHAAP